MDVPQKKCPIAAIAIDPSPFRNLGLCAQEKLKYSALDLWPMDFVKDARQKLLDMKTFLAD
jgi:hypothetical protein